MTYYKVLSEGGAAYHGGSGTWHLPTADGPGEWMPTIEDPVPCERGYHGCTREQLVYWLGPVIYEMEYDGKPIDAGDKVVGGRARLLRRLDTWNDRTARLFACDCAERVVHSTGPDERSVNAIVTARRFAIGEATKEELAAARRAAWDAARTAASTAAWTAAWDAAWDAAGDAAGTAACAAAREAGWVVAREAGWDAGRQWQTERLFWYLEGEES
jgi:hypothetical protein